MDENYLFYSIYKNQITDIVTLITEIFISVLKLETDQIKSLVFSSDKSGNCYLTPLELTLMTVLTLKHIFNKEKLKEVLDNSRLLKENYKSNQTSLESIVNLLAPLKEEKVRLFYNLIKTINSKEKVAESKCPEEASNEKNVNHKNFDQFSLRNENVSTHCSLSSNNIVVDANEQKTCFSDKRPSQGSLNQSFNSGKFCLILFVLIWNSCWTYEKKYVETSPIKSDLIMKKKIGSVILLEISKKCKSSKT